MEVRLSQLLLIAIPDKSRMGVSRGRKAPRSSVVGRLLDTFDKDAGGVSALQHSARSAIPLACGAMQRGEKWNR
jgi:hypothetical protein